MKLIHFQILLISALTTALIPFYSLAIDVNSSAQEPIKAEIKNIGDQGQELQVLEKKSSGLLPVADQPKVITAKNRLLLVPSGSKKPFGHLRFFTSSGAIDPLVQVGPNTQRTTYKFPCTIVNGKFMFAWGLINNTKGGLCHGIIKVRDIGQVSRIQTVPFFLSKTPDITQFASSLLKTKALSNFLTSQADSSEKINVSPESIGITIVQVDSSAERVIIDALVGNAKVTTDSQQEGISLREGFSYDSSKPETIEPIKITEETRWAIAVFVDPKNWTESVAPQIPTLQQQPSLQKFLEREVIIDYGGLGRPQNPPIEVPR
ncbi:MAG: hypothetical protein HWQ35_14935 [Nostoc sp. NMS1]|uniref:hypothetical protein n=1 Tax=unclassified Nostoc TaxID=2593658 RepID=UPI0025E20B4D|nr:MULTISPECIES: hypothetical protein [unclassified Nostoc]MBN3907801.1 hypothetical protein [Nostoc sp. NMS1]MBN3991188.1 hypothetical protein [Nostoc sp. NMS2]